MKFPGNFREKIGKNPGKFPTEFPKEVPRRAISGYSGGASGRCFGGFDMFFGQLSVNFPDEFSVNNG